LPEELSHFLVTQYLDLPAAFTVFCVCKTWNSYKSEALIQLLCEIRFDLVDYQKPADKDWKWVALSKLPFTASNFYGVGTQRINEGTYEGEFVDGVPCGKGNYKWQDASYYGEWKGGDCSGYGVMVWTCGHKYEGNFKMGKQSGFGKFTFSNGDTYVGNWKKGRRNGTGKFTWDTGDTYEGEWKEGYREGKGKFLWSNGDSYDGAWVAGAREGKGILVWANGEWYDGDWLNDERTGYGVFHWNNGDLYEGSWHDSIQHNYGKLVWGNGNSFNGEWKNGNKYDGVLFEKPSGRTFHRNQNEDNLKIDHTFLHPLVSNAMKRNICTYSVTAGSPFVKGPSCYFQYLYKTKDNDERTHGVCISCYNTCVPHYATALFTPKMFYGGNFYCDCGAGNLDQKCTCVEECAAVQEEKKFNTTT
jgi:hypothetical protein